MKPMFGSSGPEKQQPAAEPKVASKAEPLQPIVSKAISSKQAEGKPPVGMTLTAADDSLLDWVENIMLSEDNPTTALEDFFIQRNPSSFSQQGLLDAKYVMANLLPIDIAMECLKIIKDVEAGLPKTAEATAIKADGIVIQNSERKPSVISIRHIPPSKLTSEDIVLIKAAQTGTNNSIDRAVWQDNVSPAGVKAALIAAEQSKRAENITDLLISRLDTMASPEDDWQSVSSEEEKEEMMGLIFENHEIGREYKSISPPKASLPAGVSKERKADLQLLSQIDSDSSIKDLGLTEDSLIELLKRNPDIKIRYLDLSDSSITRITEILDLCPGIQKLIARNCKITNELARQIADHPQSRTLRFLNLAQNQIGDEGARHIAKMTELNFLNLLLNQISNETEKYIQETLLLQTNLGVFVRPPAPVVPTSGPSWRRPPSDSEDEKSDDEDYEMPPPEPFSHPSSISTEKTPKLPELELTPERMITYYINLDSPIIELGLTEESLIDLLRKNPHPPVTVLNLTGMRITNIAAILDACPQITQLKASNCQITDEVVKQIIRHPNSENIRGLFLNNNDITDVGAKLLLTKPKLTLVVLRNNPITSETYQRLRNELEARKGIFAGGELPSSKQNPEISRFQTQAAEKSKEQGRAEFSTKPSAIGEQKEDLTLVAGPKQPVSKWAQEKYCKQNDPTDMKYQRRASLVSTYYEMPHVRKTHADGNCFYNSCSAILLEKMNKDPTFRSHVLTKLRTFQENARVSYIRPQSGGQFRDFTKEEDFTIVINHLTESSGLDSYIENQEFMNAFSRVLRYSTQVQTVIDGEVENNGDTFRDYNYTEPGFGLEKFNQTFGLHCEVAIISSQNPTNEEYWVDMPKANEVTIIQGQYEQSRVNVQEKRGPSSIDGVILQSYNHFVVLC